ncbi:hypothetical protein BLOT_011867 [Blomia tropicalis]|nr:hypothetical protein BLOT_011867 [Blomia tropicalis]
MRKILRKKNLILILPLFDRKIQFEEITHYYNPYMNESELCSIHGWTLNKNVKNQKVIDSVIFSIELDLLELRLRELWNVVDRFLVLETDRTFSGKPKPLILKTHLETRFAWARSKLSVKYVINKLRVLKNGESPFVNEITMRKEMDRFVRSEAIDGDLIIVSDVDEIPRANTIHLLKICSDYPLPLHLQLKTYFYSFEFFFSYTDSWRANVQRFDKNKFQYSHGKQSNIILADSGWHCTFCFRELKDFRFKMTSYSHNDRLMGRTNLLNNEEIQRRICSGDDVYDMYPEVYSFKELVQKFGRIPKTTSLIDLPRGLLQNRNRMKYLLPGNCRRPDYIILK